MGEQDTLNKSEINVNVYIDLAGNGRNIIKDVLGFQMKQDDA